MHILGISGSLRAESSTTALLRALAALAPTTMEVSLYEGLADLPHFSPDLDVEPAHPAVAQLRTALHAADGVVICTPEYAYGVPGSLKNALDWVVSSGEFAGKPVGVLSASPFSSGGDRAHASLMLTLTAEAARIVEGATLTVPFVRQKLDIGDGRTDAALEQALRGALAALAESITAP